jgi:predicted DNA-binding transcriptional regulator YafY
MKEGQNMEQKGTLSTHKHDRVLDIYNRLLNGEVINKQTLAEEYGVAPRSIQRDIDSIRNFYEEHAAKGETSAEIRYDRAAGGFRIINKKTVTLTNAELYSVAKILLESRSLNKSEMERIINDLIEACLPLSEKKKMRELILNELFNYVEPRHGKELVNSIWELGSAICSHHKIQLEYQKVNGDITNALVKPIGILNSEYYFYLIAYIGDHDKKYPGYPTFYRIDRIKQFKVTKEVFHVPYRDRFEEGEFRKRLQFMYGGPLTHVNFVYTGSDINAILDRLPTAQTTRQEDGSYRVSAEVYGEQGLQLWMKGQDQIQNQA